MTSVYSVLFRLIRLQNTVCESVAHNTEEPVEVSTSQNADLSGDIFCFSHGAREADGGETLRRNSHLRDLEDHSVQQPRDPCQDGAGDGH